MPEQQQQSGHDGSTDLLWIAGILVAGVYFGWYFGKVYISAAVLYVRFYEMLVISFVINAWIKLMQFTGLPQPQFLINQWLTYVQHHISGVGIDFPVLLKLSTTVGDYLKYPLVLLMVGGAVLLHFGSSVHKLRRIFTTRTFREAEQDVWPQIKPVLKFDLVKQKLTEGSWAMSLSPMLFCKKHDLLSVEQVNEKYIATLRRGSAHRILSLQLGPKWCGPERLPLYLTALFAVFAACINGDKKSAISLLDQIAISSVSGQLNFDGATELMRKHANTKSVVKITSLHGYITTMLASMLVGARTAGVLATAEFIWLKPIDRRMWYMLNTVGRPTAVAEISGAYAHWLAEKKLGLPLAVPMVEEGVRGLEVALSEMIYKPDEEE